MRQLARLAFGSAAFVLLLLSEALSQTAPAEPQRNCMVLGVQPDAVLERCGENLRALTLTFRDVRRVMGVDQSGTLNFVCPVETLCEGEPTVSGWLIDPRRWINSAHDEDAIFSIVQTPPVVLRNRRPPQPERPTPAATCPIFDVWIADLPGRAVCYESDDLTQSGLFAVVASSEIGFLLVFRHRELDSKALREKVLTILPRFQIDVASGDGGLFRWMR